MEAAALQRYMEPRLPGASALTVNNLFRIPGGASRETWMYDAEWTEGGQRKSAPFVVRIDPPASLVESDREVEYAFYSAFAGTSVPVPAMRWLEQDPQHLGAPFFIMDRIVGCESGPRVLLEPRFQAAQPMLARRFYEILGDIQKFDWRGSPIESAVPIPAANECWERELAYWEGMIDKNEQSPNPITRAAIRWLRANPPPPAKKVVVVHGDYRVGNFLYTNDGIHGVLDWEMAHLGDPLEDLAWSCHEVWEWGRGGKKGGIIALNEAIAVYEKASGFKVDRKALHWWDVFSGVKGQGIWLTGARSYADGRTQELIMVTTSYWLLNFQEEVLLRSLGRGA